MEESELAKKSDALAIKYLGRELVEFLTGPTQKDWVETRPIRGGGKASYVPGYRFTQKLNQAFGFLWSSKVKEHFQVDNHLVALVQLSIKVPGRTFIKENPDGTKETTIFEGLEIVKEQFGGSEVKKYAKDVTNPKTGKTTYKIGDVIDLADDYKGAATDGLKKCGISLGMFMDVYSSRGAEEEGITSAQFEALYARGKDAGMDEKAVEDWVKEQTGKESKDCEPLELMGLIPELIKLAEKREEEG